MERLWGGRRLATVFGKALPPAQRIGESWEMVDRPEAQSVVRRGPWRGRTLHELWSAERAEIFGDDLPPALRFPILAKVLDAREKLSLQVHPGPASSGGEAKTEMWYFAQALPGAEIFAGLRRGVERSDFEEAVRTGKTAELIHRLEVETGDSFFVPSGRLHAIGAGNLLIEIQQNSDTTYRVFDWNRTAPDGTRRDLQVDEALQAIDFTDSEPAMIQPEGETLVSCPYFMVEKWELIQPRAASERRAFALFVCLTGAVEAGGEQFVPGEFFLIPANAAATELHPGGPGSSLLRITLPATR